MENRIVLKKISFLNDKINTPIDIKIKLYHDKIIKNTEILWDYTDEIINWKFIINYNDKSPIDFIILENLEQENIIGSFTLLNKTVKPSYNLFKIPNPIVSELDIIKNNEKIGKIIVYQYIIFKSVSFFLPSGEGWSLPNKNPKLDVLPMKEKFDLNSGIHIIKDRFYDQKTKYDKYGEAFYKIINDNNNQPPLCFGIIGSDDFGKTDVFSSLKKTIIKNNNTNNIIIEFNPWSFEADDTIWASILISIHDALENKYGKLNLRWLRIKRNIFPSFISVIYFSLKLVIMILLIVAIILYFNNNSTINIVITFILSALSLYLLYKDLYFLGYNLIYSLSNVILSKIKKPDWSKEVGFMNEIKNEFFKFVDPVIKEYNCKLILLIDDLDKCSIEKVYLVVKVLNLLKYSDCPIYIFLTYDSKKIYEALTNYYKIKYFINSYDSKYIMNKLINIPFCLPGREIVDNLNLLYDNEKVNKTPKLSITFEDNDKFLMMNNFVSNIEDTSVSIYINEKGEENNLEKLKNIVSNINNLTELEKYKNYINQLKNDNNINEIRQIINNKFSDYKNNFVRNYYAGLNSDEIKVFQSIIENTKTSGHALTNNKLIRIINIFSIARYLLPSNLNFKKFLLLHLIVITENWLKIVLQIYNDVKKIKFNLSSTELLNCFNDKMLLFYYLNNLKFHQNDEFILYLTKFEISMIDFIDLEPYIFNLDRCFTP